MIPGRIEGATSVFGKPANWDDAQGHCAQLPVRQALIDGDVVLISAWHPTPEELVKLVAGETVKLTIWGIHHPVVALGVGDVA